MNPVFEYQGWDQMKVILEEQQKTLQVVQQEQNEWQRNIQYLQQLQNNQQISKQQLIQQQDELHQINNLSTNSSIHIKDFKLEQLQAQDLILKTQTQIRFIRNNISNLRQMYMEQFDSLRNNHAQQKIKQPNYQLKEIKEKKLLQKRNKIMAKSEIEKQKIEKVIALKEFHDNQQSITFVKPDQFDQYQSDSDLQDFYEQNFFPTNCTNSELKVRSNQSLILILTIKDLNRIIKLIRKQKQSYQQKLSRLISQFNQLNQDRKLAFRIGVQR